MDPWGIVDVGGLPGRRGGRGRGRPRVGLVVVRRSGETLRQGASSVGTLGKYVLCWILSEQVRVVNQPIVRFRHSPLLLFLALLLFLLRVLANAVATEPAGAAATAAVAALALLGSRS